MAVVCELLTTDSQTLRRLEPGLLDTSRTDGNHRRYSRDDVIRLGGALEVLRAGVADSFNAMTVDGCTSTNDTVLILASGRAGAPDPAAQAFYTWAEMESDLITPKYSASRGPTIAMYGIFSSAATLRLIAPRRS